MFYCEGAVDGGDGAEDEGPEEDEGVGGGSVDGDGEAADLFEDVVAVALDEPVDDRDEEGEAEAEGEVDDHLARALEGVRRGEVSTGVWKRGVGTHFAAGGHDGLDARDLVEAPADGEGGGGDRDGDRDRQVRR